MHGHGFALMFLASVYGMITKESLRKQVQVAIRKAVTLTSQGQSGAGGWTYTPGSGDEGSVTVTQVQALRAAHNAGFLVPRAVIEESVKYLEKCRTPEGGIQYSLRSGGGPRLADLGGRRRHALQRRPVRRGHRHRLPEVRLGPVPRQRRMGQGGRPRLLFASLRRPGFLHGGRPVLGQVFPGARDQLLAMQAPDGSWHGDGIGEVYGTAIAVIILQLPFKFLPIFQRVEEGDAILSTATDDR